MDAGLETASSAARWEVSGHGGIQVSGDVRSQGDGARRRLAEHAGRHGERDIVPSRAVIRHLPGALVGLRCAGVTARVALSCVAAAFAGATVLAADDLRLVEAVKSRDASRAQTLLTARPRRVDPNAKQPDGATALHWAAHWDDERLVDLLIQAGADVNVTNDYGVTPLAVACENGGAAGIGVIER